MLHSGKELIYSLSVYLRLRLSLKAGSADFYLMFILILHEFQGDFS